MTLEELLADACEKGLTHLTVWPIPSADGKQTYWAARATPSTSHQYVAAQSKFAVDAITEVLLALPKARKRGTKITAAVTDPLLPSEDSE